MKITKLGHCCLVIETNGKRAMTDPGSYTVSEQVKEKNLDLIIITHEHGDHIHTDSLKEIIKNNPQAQIITNEGVGKLLKAIGLPYTVLENKKISNIAGVALEAHDCKHEEIFEELGQVQNIGYFIDSRLFYPGDSLYNPGKSVEILALPVAGPWTRVRDYMKYVLEINPKICFPVHDGMITKPAGSYWVLEKLLPQSNIIFKTLVDNKEEEF